MSWFFSADLSIDLGSSEIRIYQRGKGLLLKEANAVWIAKDKAIAWGWEAYEQEDLTEGEIFCPIQKGQIIDFDLTCKMLQIFFRRVGFKKINSRSRLLILVRYQLSNLQKLTLSRIFRHLGFHQIYLAASVMALAFANNSGSSMIIDLGRECTDLAVLVPKGIVSGYSLDWGSRQLDQALLNYFHARYALEWNERTMEKLKKEQISFLACQPVKASGQQIAWAELMPILQQNLQPLENKIKEMMQHLDPEVSGELWGKGVLLAGQGALLNGLEVYLRQRVNLAVVLAEEINSLNGTDYIWNIIDNKPDHGLLSSWLHWIE